MRYPKNVISVLLAALMMIAVAQAGTLLSYADTSFDEGDFRFTVTAGDVLTVSKYYGDSTNVSLPEEVNGRAVTGVYSHCFENSSVESVTIPEGYTFIGAFAFNGCTSLTEVLLPSTLENIGIMAFFNCAALNNIDFEAAENLESVGFAAFQNCSALESVSLPDSVTSIGENAFCNCTSLSELTLSENLDNIPEYAFYGCAALENVSFPASVTEIGESGFENCALSGVFVPSTVTSIGENAFAPDNDIVCFSGSAAAEYCGESGRVIDKIMGDANDDGKVNILDVTAIQRWVAELGVPEPYQKIMADVNGDGRADISDATMIQRYLAEYEVEFVER